MKKRVSLLAIAAMVCVSAVLMACQNITESALDTTEESSRTSVAKTGLSQGSVVGYVLDNSGCPVEGATVALGAKTTTTNANGHFEITDVAINDANLVNTKSSVVAGTNTTAYSLTATKKGYLPATVSGVYVTYEDIESAETKAYHESLVALYADYTKILNQYATSVATGAAASSTAVTASTEDTVTTTTTNKSTDANEVFAPIADALADIRNRLADSNYYRQNFSNFGKAVMIPLTGSFSGTVKLNLKTKGGSVYDAETYIPASTPTVRITYTPGEANAGAGGFYSWEVKVDEKGNFKFDKCLPLGVSVTLGVDSFFETINDVEYCFSGASSDLMVENSTLSINSAISINSSNNENSCVVMLYAQNDKIWVTNTNVDSTSTGNLLKTTDSLTFTFNKPMKKLDFDGKYLKTRGDPNATPATTDEYGTTDGINIKKSEYTLKWSADNKTATITPVAGYWTISGEVVLVLTGEAEDGATTILNNKFTPYFDTKVWVSLKKDSLSFSDYNDYLGLAFPIVIEFSKPMNEKIAVTLTNTDTAYTETWNSAKTELTLAPVAKAKYWNIAEGKTDVEITVNKLFASSEEFYNNDFGYWKTGAAKATDSNSEINNCLKVYFDNFVDVEVAKKELTGHEAFTVTFSKAIKNFSKKDNIETLKAGSDAVIDYEAEIDSTGKVVTIKSKGAQFNKPGFYTVTFKGLEVEDGSKIFRSIGTIGSKSKLSYKTDFAFDGFEFKPVKIEVADSLPTTAKLSRAIVNVATDKVLKITFNKPVQKSEIKVTFDGANAKAVKNYIDSTDSKVVYIPLDEANAVNKIIVLSGTVTSPADVETTKNNTVTHSDQITFNTENINKWFDNVADSYFVYSALNLTGTSLINSLDHVTGQPEYSKADPVSAGTAVTFDFDADLTGYTASYKIFGLKDVDNDAATDIKLLVENGVATISGKKVTVPGSKFVAKKTVGDTATYYVELRVNNKAGVKVFSSTSPYFGSVAGSFEAVAKSKVYDVPASENPDTTTNEHKNYGSFIVEVAEKDHLVGTSLITKEAPALTKATYSAVKSIPAKSEITFDFDIDLTDAVASYELYDAASNGKVISSGNAQISNKRVIVQDDLMISGNPKVDGKTFNVATASDSGISTYYLKLEIKNKTTGNVLFSSANKWWTAGTTDTRTDFEKAVKEIVSDDLFKIGVAPLAVENLSFVEENKDSFNVALKTYKAPAGINPKEAVTIKFNADIPAGAKYFWNIKDESGTVKDKSAAAIEVLSATKEITIQSDKMIASTTAVNNYYIDLAIMNGTEKLFATDSEYFGKASDYEKEMAKDGIGAINAAKDAFVVKVVKTQIITKKINDVESNTTKDDANGFKKSFKSPIVLQFSHPVTGYKAVLYSNSRVFYDANKETHTLSTLNADLKYEDFIKDSSEFIYKTEEPVIASNLLTITPVNYYGVNKTVNIAVFGEDGKYLADLKNDNDTVVTYSTLNDSNAFGKELSSTSASLTVKTAPGKIGDGKAVVFGIPTELSEISDDIPTYHLYVKNAESSVYTDVSSSAEGYNAAKLIGKDTYDSASNAVTGSYISRENVIFDRAPNTYFSTTLGAKAFGIRKNGKVEVVLVKELDGVYSASKAVLEDKAAPDVFTASNYITISGPATVSAVTASGSTGVISIPGVADTVAAPTDGAKECSFSFDIEIGNQYIKTVSASFENPHTNNPLAPATPVTSGVTGIEISYYANGTKAKVTVNGGKFFKDDQIKVEVTDSSGNTGLITFNIQ